MNRAVAVALAAVMLAVAPLAGCARKTVTVRTGEVVVCTAGEVIEDRTKELEVPVSEVSKHSVTTKVVTCEKHQGLAGLWEAAQAALAAGDTNAARAKLAAIVAKDPGYAGGQAKKQLDEIEGGGSPSPGTSQPGTSTAGGEEPVGPVANLLRYVPDVIDGYTAQGITADPASITRDYLPLSGNADLMVIMVEQMVDAKKAAAGLDAFRQTYPDDAAGVTVEGKQGRFGTRTGYAAIAFVDGSLLVTVEMHVRTGRPVDLKPALLKVGGIIGG
ncbi:MAG: hypothetical protein N3B11_04950 [Coriobacteriia bacterium]|nr:hypothetical protein [Coriobacteriia bacterium]